MTAVPVGLAFIVAAVAALAPVTTGGSDEAPPRGPLGTEDITAMGVPQQVGRPFSIGLPVVYNRGEAPATIERISLVEKTPGIDVLETHVGGTDRATLLNASTYGWPDKSALQRPARAARLRRTARPPQGGQARRRARLRARGARSRRTRVRGCAGRLPDRNERDRTVLWEGARICAVRKLPETIEPDCDPIDLRDRTYG